MTILDALKKDDLNVRVTIGDRWLYIDQDFLFVVREHQYRKNNTKVLIYTESEEKAVEVLLFGVQLQEKGRGKDE